MNRRGFALLAVLWVITGLATLALGGMLVAREGVASARNRIARTRAEWRAEGCAERARASLDMLLRQGGSWESLGSLFNRLRSASSSCTVRLSPAGFGVDVNEADEEQLVKLFRAVGARPGQADSVAEAVLDWRDADAVQRPFGAERGWYNAEHSPAPRDSAFGSTAELQFVRGILQLPLGDSLLVTEQGRIPLNLAPLPVIASLPGVGPEIVRRIAELRRRRERLSALDQLGLEIPPAARGAFLRRFADLSESATVEPEAWILTTTATDGVPPITAATELRLVPAAGRAAVVRRRTW